VLDSGIVGETAPMAIFMENLKDKGFPRHAKESQKTY
jgi:hypothetical protein